MTRHLRQQLSAFIDVAVCRSLLDTQILADLARRQPALWSEVKEAAGFDLVVKLAATARRKTIPAAAPNSEQQRRLFDFYGGNNGKNTNH